MIHHHVTQNSPEWEKLRLGIPTASSFDKIVTPTGKLSAQARGFAFRLVAEQILQTALATGPQTLSMQRGHELEDEAAQLYGIIRDCQPKKCGFITTEDGQIGASPDRLIGADGLLEIKCVEPQTQIGYLIDGLDKAYIPQIQGQLYVTGRKWCDWLAYNQFLPPVIIRVKRDEEYIATLSQALADFVVMKREFYETVNRLSNSGRDTFIEEFVANQGNILSGG